MASLSHNSNRHAVQYKRLVAIGHQCESFHWQISSTGTSAFPYFLRVVIMAMQRACCLRSFKLLNVISKHKTVTTLLLGYAKKVGEYIFVEDVDTCVQSAWTGGGKVRGASLRGGKMLGASH